MAKYSSNPVLVGQPVESLFNRFSDISFFQQKLDELPEQAREQLGEVKFDTDSIAISTPKTGSIKLKVTKRQAPGTIEFAAEGSPVPLKMTIDLEEKGENSTEITTSVDVEIPLLLKPLIGNKLQEAANELARLVAQINNV